MKDYDTPEYPIETLRSAAEEWIAISNEQGFVPQEKESEILGKYKIKSIIPIQKMVMKLFQEMRP
ncbi:MAG: hypothetical protein FWC00_05180 [Firmicutes bacterium]|nr:hypothetical protein [Bacillota bacterium]